MRRLTRAHRVLDAASFVRAMRQGRRFKQPMFTLHALATKRIAPRLGLAIGRRVSPRAHVRNTLKRIARESFRAHIARLPIMDIVVVFRLESARASRSELRHAFDHAFDRLIADTTPETNT